MKQRFRVLDDFFAKYRYRYVIGVIFFLIVDILQLFVPGSWVILLTGSERVS